MATVTVIKTFSMTSVAIVSLVVFVDSTSHGLQFPIYKVKKRKYCYSDEEKE